MYIERLNAKNFRCFKDLSLELSPGFNLIIGDNGAGKTAVLDALRLGIGRFFVGFDPGFQRIAIEEDDVRRVVHELNGTIDMQHQYPVHLGYQGTILGRSVVWACIRASAGPLPSIEAYMIDEFYKQTQALQNHVRAGKTDFDLPVFACYGTERLWGTRSRSGAESSQAQTRIIGYYNCLSRSLDINVVSDWLKQRTIIATQERAIFEQERRDAGAEGPAPFPPPDPFIECIAHAVTACVPGTKRIYYSIKHDELFLQFKDRRRLPFHLLSDGVRGMLLLVADLAWRAATLNPHRGAEAAQLAEGVVLIDEIDLALHPRWQLHAVRDLQRAFPKLQFVATTHSPLVLAGAEGARVLELEGDRVSVREHVYGKDSNAVLTDVMDGVARPQEISDKLEKAAALIDADDVDAARRAIAALEKILGQDDTELVRLRTALRFLHPPPAGTERAE